MLAAVLERHGGPEVFRLVSLPRPEPALHEVRIRVRACALNTGLDVRTRSNGAGRSLVFPHILGTEVAGEIDAVGGSVKSWAVGDHVVVAPQQACGECRECLNGYENACRSKRLYGIDLPGGNAEYMNVAAASLVRMLPSSALRFREAAALPIGYTTALHMLRGRARLEPGETIVVLGAGGSVGTASIQIAKLLGGKIIAAASTDEKLRTAQASGAEHLVDYKDGKFAEAVKQLTDGRGADVVVDHIGRRTWNESIASLANRGRLVMCGASSGHELSFDARPLWRKIVSFHFSNSGTIQDLRDIVSWWERGDLSPVIHQSFPLQEIVQAHRLLEIASTPGKIVITP